MVCASEHTIKQEITFTLLAVDGVCVCAHRNEKYQFKKKLTTNKQTNVHNTVIRKRVQAGPNVDRCIRFL